MQPQECRSSIKSVGATAGGGIIITIGIGGGVTTIAIGGDQMAGAGG